MAKTKTELLTEAAWILAQVQRAAPGAVPQPPENLRELLQVRINQWLQEEVSEEDGDLPPSLAEEPPTDDRWFAAYLRGIDAWGRIGGQTHADHTPSELCRAFASHVADGALAAAREQAKKDVAKPVIAE